MPATYEPIATTTLGSDAASVTFSDIPGTYTDLVLVVNAIQSFASDASMQIQFNSDTASNYSSTWLLGSGSSASSARESSVAYIYTAEMSGTTNNYPSPIITHIMSYANTNVHKTVLSAGAAPGSYVARSVGLWRSTSAITSLTVDTYGGSGSLKSGAVLSLYGIKASA